MKNETIIMSMLIEYDKLDKRFKRLCVKYGIDDERTKRALEEWKRIDEWLIDHDIDPDSKEALKMRLNLVYEPDIKTKTFEKDDGLEAISILEVIEYEQNILRLVLNGKMKFQQAKYAITRMYLHYIDSLEG